MKVIKIGVVLLAIVIIGQLVYMYTSGLLPINSHKNEAVLRQFQDQYLKDIKDYMSQTEKPLATMYMATAYSGYIGFVKREDETLTFQTVDTAGKQLELYGKWPQEKVRLYEEYEEGLRIIDNSRMTPGSPVLVRQFGEITRNNTNPDDRDYFLEVILQEKNNL